MSAEARRLVAEDCAAASTPEVLEALAPLREELLVITGGTGFVGTWLTELVTHLNDQHGFGARLHLVARRADVFQAMAPHLAQRKDVFVEERDVRDLVELPRDAGWLVHAAGSPDNRLHASDPVRTLQTFVHGTDAVLRAAGRLEHLRRLLHVSSGLVYGPQPLELERIPESYVGPAPFDAVSAVYPEAKRAAETLAAAYRSAHRLSMVTVRPFAFIGPYQSLTAPWAVNNFLQDALHGGPIRILGNGETVRSYTYPTDMAIGMLTAMVHGRRGLAYNLGSEISVTLRDLARCIAGHAGDNVQVVEGAPGQRRAEPSRFVPETQAATEDLRFAPTVGLDAAIRRTLAWHRATGAESRGQPPSRPVRAVGSAG